MPRKPPHQARTRPAPGTNAVLGLEKASLPGLQSAGGLEESEGILSPKRLFFQIPYQHGPWKNAVLGAFWCESGDGVINRQAGRRVTPARFLCYSRPKRASWFLNFEKTRRKPFCLAFSQKRRRWLLEQLARDLNVRDPRKLHQIARRGPAQRRGEADPGTEAPEQECG